MKKASLKKLQDRKEFPNVPFYFEKTFPISFVTLVDEQ